ncbi:MAG TPA: histidinol phosphate phosphatase [Verrucomicrobiales bacterium]|nr:histidinol phosphate phosphatase [Verrucomicrobiales bacterium]
MLPSDYHMHTPLCRHAIGEPIEYARRARELGIREIGFSEHSPMARDDFDDWRMLLGQMDQYLAAVALARREVPEVNILVGLEVDYIPGHEEWIRHLATLHDWDYFIGSVHYLSDWAIDDPRFIGRWRSSEPFEVWKLYFNTLTSAVNCNLFQIIGHADLPKKFNIRPTQDCGPLYAPFLDAAANLGVAIELNTAGLRKDCREIYPNPQLLTMACERNVPITFGSDAHAPDEVGADFEAAIELARRAGYHSSVRFEKRRRLDGAFKLSPVRAAAEPVGVPAK